MGVIKASSASSRCSTHIHVSMDSHISNNIHITNDKIGSHRQY